MWYFLRHPFKTFVVLLTLVLVILLSSSLYAEDDDIMGDGMGGDFKFIPGKKWSEAELPLPAMPTDDGLIPVKIFQMPGYRYYIDRASLNSTAGDNIVRYAVVIEPPSGMRNISYEGIRCDTQEYKVYANALWGNEYQPAYQPAWRPITQQTSVRAYRYDLYQYFLCQDSITRGKEKDIIFLLESPSDTFLNENIE